MLYGHTESEIRESDRNIVCEIRYLVCLSWPTGVGISDGNLAGLIIHNTLVDDIYKKIDSAVGLQTSIPKEFILLKYILIILYQIPYLVFLGPTIFPFLDM